MIELYCLLAFTIDEKSSQYNCPLLEGYIFSLQLLLLSFHSFELKKLRHSENFTAMWSRCGLPFIYTACD